MDAPLDTLAAAIRSRDASAVARVLAERPDVKPLLNEPLPGEPFGATPLLKAVHQSNREMVDVLLEAGADIDQRSHWWAGSFGVLDHDGPLAEFLVSRGATVDAYAAARHGWLDRLRAIVAADPAAVRIRGGDGQTPLHVAASVDVARFLLDHGADIDARDVDHEATAAQYLVRDRPEVARLLVERGCRTDILLVAALGDADRVRQHLDADPGSVRTRVSEEWFPKQDPRSGGHIYTWTLGSGKTPHVAAYEAGHRAVYDLLIERSPKGLQLAVACQVGDEPLLARLRREEPPLTETLTDAERRALPDAVRDENREAMMRLLDAGWPVDARGQHGGTALHWAGWHGDTDMARALLSRGAPLDAKDDDYGGTPLSWAIYASVHGWRCRTGDYAGTVELLLDAGAQPLEVTPDLETTDAVRAVLMRGGRR